MTIALVTGKRTESAEYKFEDQRITVPDGFVVEKIAGHPLTSRPITTDFDEEGRLYVGESSGSNDNVDIQLKQKPHSILRLEDSDGDGVFDQRTVFADNMMLPEGTLWHNGSLYVTAPPEIWKLTDTDDDGVADEREVWYDPGTLTGCANDLHGPYLGLDGWIYWCKGAFDEQRHILKSGEEFVSRAAHIFRRHPSGGGVEVVMTGGMDNPVEVAFMPSGERIFSATFIQHPGGGNRDGLIHAIYGGTYGKVHGVIESHPRTGDILPIMTHLGPAAACALVRYESSALGEIYRDNLFSSSFNMSKVMRHELVKEGASYRTVDSDFLVSDSSDFHPTHIEEDADGSLMVVDTGGWYKLRCPTSQLHKPDVYGGIYRIRKVDADIVDDPRGLRLSWDRLSLSDLVGLLEDERVAVRKRAMGQLATIGSPAVSRLRGMLSADTPVDARLLSVWTLSRIDDPNARRATQMALADPNENVRQAAIHSIGLWRDSSAIPELLELVVKGLPHNRRAAAEALGRIGDAKAVESILESVRDPIDRLFEHSIIYALIEIGDADSVWSALKSSDPNVLHAGLIALDQMPQGDLGAEAVIPFMQSTVPLLRDAADWIISRHSDWGKELVEYYQTRLQESELASKEAEQIRLRLSDTLEDPATQRLIAEGLESGQGRYLEICLRALEGSRLNQMPESWVEPLASLLQVDNGQLAMVVRAIGSLPIEKVESESLSSRLGLISQDERVSRIARLKALEALSRSLLVLNDSQFEFLVHSLDGNEPLSERISAANSLSKAKLSVQQLARLADFIEKASPLQLRPILSAFKRVSDEAVGKKLVAQLRAAIALGSLRPDELRAVVAEYPNSVKIEAEALYKLIDSGAEDRAAHIEHLLSTLPEGDIQRGQNVFNSSQTACNACHAIGYKGGNVGPDLTTIGQIRTKRDLLEAVIYPNSSLVRSYETYQVRTHSGEEYLGILKENTATMTELLLGIGQSIAIPSEEIKDLVPTNTSIMPTGLTASLSEQEIADLVAFLKDTKWR